MWLDLCPNTIFFTESRAKCGLICVRLVLDLDPTRQKKETNSSPKAEALAWTRTEQHVTYRPQSSTSPTPASYCLHPYPHSSPARINPPPPLPPEPTHATSPLADDDHEGGAEPGPGAVHGPVVRDRVLPVHVPAKDGHQHARDLHAEPGRRHREGAERDVDRRPARPHRGHGVARRPGQRRGQAQGPLLRAALPPRLPRHRRLLGAPRRRRVPVRARRPALAQVPLGQLFAPISQVASRPNSLFPQLICFVSGVYGWV
jgi:hypothetical protein